MSQLLSLWKITKESPNIYLQIILGIGLGILIETFGKFFSEIIGMWLYMTIFPAYRLVGFFYPDKGLKDIAAWFIGLIVFFGAEPT